MISGQEPDDRFIQKNKFISACHSYHDRTALKLYQDEINMGFSTHYSNDLGFMLTRVYGDINDSDLLQHITELNKKTEKLVIRQELSDCRNITSVASLATKTATRAAQIEQKKINSRMAILIPKNNQAIYGLARAYQMFAEDKRAAISIFSEIDAAVSWLANADAHEKELLLTFINNA